MVGVERELCQSGRPFFLMCHHKAPHRSFEPHPKYRGLFEGEDVKMPDTFDDDYKNRARAAGAGAAGNV